MTLAELALAALLSLPRPYGAEPDPAYSDRMAVIAEAEATAAIGCATWKRSPEELVLALTVLAWYEGGLLRRVQAGQCAPNECDPVRWGPKPWQVSHRAVSLWQLHATPLVPHAEWASLAGVSPSNTARAASAAARVFAEGHRRCRSLHGAFAFYAGRPACSWRPAYQRTWRLGRLAKRFGVSVGR